MHLCSINFLGGRCYTRTEPSQKMSNGIKVYVGGVPSNFEEWTTAEVYFHGFGDLSRDDYTRSPEFSCFGHKWELLLYPGGVVGSRDGYVAVYFANMSNAAIKIQWCCSVRDAAGKGVVYRVS